jgi:peptidoglycan hydrolase-like protein with peptidoglycan-binding domain
MSNGEEFYYSVVQGDSMPSIAKQTGFFWESLWNHGNNSDLKSQRKNPNVLFSGDQVFIPALDPFTDSKATDAQHKYRRKGVPVKLVLKLLKSDGSPRANEAYVLTVDNKDLKGNTDGDGVLKQYIPNDAKEGILKLNGGKECFPVRIGGLDPVDEISGIQQRLANLGFDCEETGQLDDATQRALTNFQGANNLDPSGQPDDPTKNKLLELTQ